MVSVKVAVDCRRRRTVRDQRHMRPICRRRCRRSIAPPVEEFVASGWYLRGDIGMTNQQFNGLHQRLYDVPGTTGRQRSAWAGTARRSSASASATSSTTGSASTSPANIAARRSSTARTTSTSPAARGVDNYSRQQVRVGVPGQRLCRSRHLVVRHAVRRRRRRRRLHHDQRLPRRSASSPAACRRHSASYADDASKWNFAWALHAGVCLQGDADDVSVELAYRYLDLGSATTGAIARLRRQLQQRSARRSHFNNITSHDFKLGVRWMLEPPAQPQPIDAAAADARAAERDCPRECDRGQSVTAHHASAWRLLVAFAARAAMPPRRRGLARRIGPARLGTPATATRPALRAGELTARGWYVRGDSRLPLAISVGSRWLDFAHDASSSQHVVQRRLGSARSVASSATSIAMVIRAPTLDGSTTASHRSSDPPRLTTAARSTQPQMTRAPAPHFDTRRRRCAQRLRRSRAPRRLRHSCPMRSAARRRRVAIVRSATGLRPTTSACRARRRRRRHTAADCNFVPRPSDDRTALIYGYAGGFGVDVGYRCRTCSCAPSGNTSSSPGAGHQHPRRHRTHRRRRQVLNSASASAICCTRLTLSTRRLTRRASFLISGGGTPLPTEGRLSGRIEP